MSIKRRGGEKDGNYFYQFHQYSAKTLREKLDALDIFVETRQWKKARITLVLLNYMVAKNKSWEARNER